MATTCKGAEAVVTIKVKAKGCRRAGKDALKDFQLEFDGTRAYLVWDAVSVGCLLFKARVELNPRLLRRIDGGSSKYYYRGKITLPRPENN
jgi:hypothetical protein